MLLSCTLTYPSSSPSSSSFSYSPRLFFSHSLPITTRRRRSKFKSISSSSSKITSSAGESQTDAQDQYGDNVHREGPDLQTLLRRFWKVAAPYWSSEDKVQARLRLTSVFALTLATTGISVGFNFLGRDFYNALANKDQEQFTKQLLYYLGAFAGGIPVSTLLHSCSSLF